MNQSKKAELMEEVLNESGAEIFAGDMLNALEFCGLMLKPDKNGKARKAYKKHIKKIKRSYDEYMEEDQGYIKVEFN